MEEGRLTGLSLNKYTIGEEGEATQTIQWLENDDGWSAAFHGGRAVIEGARDKGNRDANEIEKEREQKVNAATTVLCLLLLLWTAGPQRWDMHDSRKPVDWINSFLITLPHCASTPSVGTVRVSFQKDTLLSDGALIMPPVPLSIKCQLLEKRETETRINLGIFKYKMAYDHHHYHHAIAICYSLNKIKGGEQIHYYTHIHILRTRERYDAVQM